MKYYAVRKGFVPGIYFSWDDCQKMTNGFAGAEYKSFKTIDEAGEYLRPIPEEGDCQKEFRADKQSKRTACDTRELVVEQPDTSIPYAFVDGSYNQVTKVYGYGGFLVTDEGKFIVQGSGRDIEMAAMRNVAGEILGSMAAIKLAIDKKQTSLTIYYDYMGVEKWATGQWKRNKTATIAYYEFIQSVKNYIRLSFVHVKGHTGVDGNEEADRLAKESVGITI